MFITGVEEMFIIQEELLQSRAIFEESKLRMGNDGGGEKVTDAVEDNPLQYLGERTEQRNRAIIRD